MNSVRNLSHTPLNFFLFYGLMRFTSLFTLTSSVKCFVDALRNDHILPPSGCEEVFLQEVLSHAYTLGGCLRIFADIFHSEGRETVVP